jgi:hypothetical protein
MTYNRMLAFSLAANSPQSCSNSPLFRELSRESVSLFAFVSLAFFAISLRAVANFVVPIAAEFIMSSIGLHITASCLRLR